MMLPSRNSLWALVTSLVSFGALLRLDGATSARPFAESSLGSMASGVGQESGEGGKLPPNLQKRDHKDGVWKLDFTFYDSKNGKHEVGCTINEQDHEKLSLRQGVYLARKPEELDKKIAKLVTNVAKRLGAEGRGCVIPSDWVGPTWGWHFPLPSGSDFEERKERFERWRGEGYERERLNRLDHWAQLHDCALPKSPQEDPEIQAMNAELAESLKKEAAKLGLEEYGTVDPSQRIGVDWEWRISARRNPDHAKVKASLLKWLAEEYPKERSAQEAQYMRERGFRWEPEAEKWVLDYSILVQQASPALNNCIQNIGNTLGKDEDVESMMAFFVTIPRARIPRIDPDGKDTEGFRVSTSVLIENSGDCDSKAVVFCAVQRSLGKRLVIFRTFPPPAIEDEMSHALVGVEAYSEKEGPWTDPPSFDAGTLDIGQYKFPIRVDNRYYWPCEVGGPGWNDFKSVAKERGGYYEAIQIRPLEAAVAGI